MAGHFFKKMGIFVTQEVSPGLGEKESPGDRYLTETEVPPGA